MSNVFQSNFSLLVAALAVLLTGCVDKAKPDFERCQRLQADKKYDDAREACQRAVAADPESTSGKLAAARIPVLQTESMKADQASRRERAEIMGRVEAAEAKGAELKAKLAAAIARVAKLQDQVDHAEDATDKARLEGELASATKEKAAIAAEMRGSNQGSGRKPCACPPGDPLCSCL